MNEVDLQQKVLQGGEADSIRQNPVFQEAVKRARARAIETVLTGDLEEIEEIRNARALVFAIDRLTTELANMILDGQSAGKRLRRGK